MKKKVLLISALAAGIVTAYGQRWEPASQRSSQINENIEVQYSYNVDIHSLRNILKDAVETGKGAKPVIVSLPTAEGRIEKFAVFSNPVMDQSLVEQYQLGSYVGVGVDDPDKYLRFSTAPTEMQSMIIKDGKFQFIEPISTDKKTYGVFYKTKKESGEHGFKCGTEEHNFKDISKLAENGKKQLSNIGITQRPTNTRYRNFRMALSVTGEYSQFFLTAAGTPANATADVKRGIVLTAMNNTMTRINGVFERDFGAHLTVQNLPGIIYLNSATDPYTGANPNNILSLQVQQILTSDVGNANYDIGFVFNRHVTDRSGMVGQIGGVCNNPVNNVNNGMAKGSGHSQSTQPLGEDFDFVSAHEMGHQLGANHTFSMRSEQLITNANANVEPGGGTTIMGYPGITQDNIQNNIDGYFHYKSIDQVLDNLESKPTCGTQTNIITNTAPAINALTAYTIPKGTAYYLEATATDTQNDPMNYTWEQYNSVGGINSISGDSGWGYNTEGALARSLPGTSTGKRYFPKLSSVMNGNLTDKQGWETVSYIPRILNYAVTVRDQNAQRPMTSTAETTVTVGNQGPFKFNGLTTSSILYNNAPNTIKWEVDGTNIAPYNVANVKVDYTSDNGLNWTTLAASVPNNGSFDVQMPGNLTGSIKLRVSAIGNIFYAVSPAVTIGTAPVSTTAAPTGVSTIDTEIFKTTARVSWNKVPGATYSINYRKTGTTNWLNTISQTNSVVLNNLEDESDYEVQVAAVVNSVSGTFSNNYAFRTKGLRTAVDYCLMTTGGNGVTNSGLVSLTLSNLTYAATGPEYYKTFLDFSENATRIINLTRGSQYNLSFRNVGSQNITDRLEVWIDYNRNGTFENVEKVVTSSGASIAVLNGQAYIRDGNATFTVPNAAYAGNKLLRMRVASTVQNTATGPCGSPSYTESWGGLFSAGSFRDFSVRIAGNNALASRQMTDTNSSSSEISIYPNPADNFVEVKNLKGKTEYKIYNPEGRLVKEGKVNAERIDVSGLVKGLYVISITDETKTYSTKLIKK